MSKKNINNLIGRTEFEREDFFKLLWVQITSIGQENIYFKYQDAKGHIYDGFCKCL
jgi:hypothetical protein